MFSVMSLPHACQGRHRSAVAFKLSHWCTSVVISGSGTKNNSCCGGLACACVQGLVHVVDSTSAANGFAYDELGRLVAVHLVVQVPQCLLVQATSHLQGGGGAPMASSSTTRLFFLLHRHWRLGLQECAHMQRCATSQHRYRVLAVAPL